MRNRVMVPAIILTLVGASGAGHASDLPPEALRIDLSDPDPEGLDLLPGISEAEAAALARAAGPGPTRLGERLAGTGLSPARLREWAPYVVLTGAPGEDEPAWTLHSSLHGEGRRVQGSRLRVSVGGRRARMSCLMEGERERARLTGWAGIATPAGDLVAGSIACGFTGGDLWNDPIASLGSRSTSVSPMGLQPSARAGSRGVILDRAETGAIGLWRDETSDLGVALALGRSNGFSLACGGIRKAGAGVAFRLAAGDAVLRLAAQRPRGLSPAWVLDASRRGESRGRIRVAWSFRPQGNEAQGTVGGTAGGRFRSLHWAASGTLLGPRGASRSPILWDLGVDRGGRVGSWSATLAWGQRGGTGRVALGRAVRVPQGGVIHVESATEMEGAHACRSRIRLTLLRRPLRMEIASASFGGGRRPSDRIWTWRFSMEQRRGKAGAGRAGE